MSPAWSPPATILEVAGEDSSLVTEMIETYQSDMAKRADQVRVATANSDTAALQHQVHAIKGSSKQMEAHAVASLCEQIEAQLRVRSIDAVRGMAQQLEMRIQEACAAMAPYQK
jgi:HPt (histidine-containing phosphotransfer) domain-containing protein